MLVKLKLRKKTKPKYLMKKMILSCFLLSLQKQIFTKKTIPKYNEKKNNLRKKLNDNLSFDYPDK